MAVSGSEKDYGKDKAKREVRKRFSDFIDRSLNKHRHGGTKVLCLPGRDLHEFNEIYAHLGVRSANLSIVERDKINARLIKASLPDAEVYAGELLDYVGKTDKRFDVISLDFCTNYSPHVKKILFAIRYRELLKDRGVLLVAVAGRRELAASKEELREMVELASLHETPAQTVETTMLGHRIPMELIERNIGKVRSDALSHAVACSLLDGPSWVYVDWVLRQGNQNLMRRIEEIAIRLHIECTLKQNSMVLKDKYGIDVEPSDGKRVGKFGINFGVPGYMTNEDVEERIKVIQHGKFVVLEGDHTTIDVENNVFGIAERTYTNFQKILWCGVGALPSEIDEQTQLMAYGLLKHALMTLFREDLREHVFRFKRGGLKTHYEDAGLMFEYTMSQRAGVYWITGMERYKYVSDSSCPMLVDMAVASRCFRYEQIVMVSPEGKIIPYVSEKALRTGNPKKVKKEIERNFGGYDDFKRELTGTMHLTGNADYPERIEVEGEDVDMCENCSALETQLDLLKSQLVEMRNILKSKKVVRKAMRVGNYDRAKIIEMIQAGRDNEYIQKELNISVGTISAVKAWMKIGGEEYIRKHTG